jgi:hypothetical protein
VPKENAGHFAPMINLRDARCPHAMAYGQLYDLIASPVHTSYKLPPEALIHGAQFAAQARRYRPLNQYVGTTGVVDWRAKNGLIDQIKESRTGSPDKRIGAIRTPAQNNVGLVARFPE